MGNSVVRWRIEDGCLYRDVSAGQAGDLRKTTCGRRANAAERLWRGEGAAVVGMIIAMRSEAATAYQSAAVLQVTVRSKVGSKSRAIWGGVQVEASAAEFRLHAVERCCSAEAWMTEEWLAIEQMRPARLSTAMDTRFGCH